jgi:PAS domain S-box-containing protein
MMAGDFAGTRGTVFVVLAACASSFASCLSPPKRLAGQSLTRVQDVLRLSADEARRRHPVRLRATVTYCEPRESTLFVQDATGGILVDVAGRDTSLQAGQVVEVEGVTEAGPGPPMVVEPVLRVVGSAPMPTARRVTTSHLKGESARYQWVELQGTIALFHEDGEPRLVLNEYRGFVRLRVADLQGRAPETLVGEEMRVRGVFGPLFDARRDVAGYQVWVPSASFLEKAPVSKKATSPGEGLPLLTRVAQVLALTPEEASRGYPVLVTGVVTYQDAEWCMLFVQDATAGIYTQCRSHGFPVEVGQRVEVRGMSGPGEFAPVIDGPELRLLGPGPLPRPKALSFEQLPYIQGESQWVEIGGTVQSVRRVGVLHAAFDLVTAGGRTTVSIPEVAELPMRLVGARARFRGVGISIFNKKRQLLGTEVLAPSLAFVAVEEPAPADPFAAPVRAVDSLMRYRLGADLSHRVRVQGVVAHRRPTGSFYMMDETGGLLVLISDPTRLVPGDRVDVVGFPGRGEYAPVLRGALFRRLGTGAPPEPVRITAEQALTGDYDGALVHLEAWLLDRSIAAGTQVLVLQAAPFVFHALLEDAEAGALASLRSGSRLQLTGICTVSVDERQVPRSFQLLLRTPADVRVLQSAPWWTLRHTLWSLGLMASSISAALAWVALLRRRVRVRTEALQVQTARFRELVENASDVIYTLDNQGRFTSLNRAGERITGYPEQEVLGRELAGLVTPEHAARVDAMLSPSPADAALPVHELQVVAKDGHTVTLEVSSRPIREDGRVMGTQGIGRDVTERNQAQEMRARFAAVLEERSRIARELHDSLDQGFWGILLQVEAAAKSLDNAPQGTHAHLDMARNLVLHCQNEAHRSVWDLRSCALERSDLASGLDAVARQVSADAPVDVTTEVMGTPFPMRAVVEDNLLRIGQEAMTNAVRHAAAKRVRTELRFEPGAIRLVVTDDGSGFDVDSPAHATNGRFGLIGMRERAKRIGGRLKIESVPGTGTKVEVELGMDALAPGPASPHGG